MTPFRFFSFLAATLVSLACLHVQVLTGVDAAVTLPEKFTRSDIINRSVVLKDDGSNSETSTHSSLAKRIVVFTPPSSYDGDKVIYARHIYLGNGRLLATWAEGSRPQNPYLPIWESLDHGSTWHVLSIVEDQTNSGGLREEPMLYVLPSAFGGFKAGTILLAANAVPYDRSKCALQVYASTDRGKTFKYVSTMATGGQSIPDTGYPAIWEPFLLLHGNKMLAYFSDQRDSCCSQKISMVSSTDLKKWSGATDVQALPSNKAARPGMPVVTQLGSSGKWMVTFEQYQNANINFDVFYKIASSPEAFGSATAVHLRSSDGQKIRSSPYCLWVNTGGPSGTTIISSGTNQQLFISKDMGATSKWTPLNNPAPSGYSRSLGWDPDTKQLTVMSAGHLGKGSTNKVSFDNVSL